MSRDRLDVQAGIMSIPEYREKWYGEDEETAKEKYQEHFLYNIINNYINALASGAITPEQYVEIAFPNAGNKQEIIEYIEKFVSKQEADVQDFLYEGNEGERDAVQIDEELQAENQAEESQEEIEEIV